MDQFSILHNIRIINHFYTLYTVKSQIKTNFLKEQQGIQMAGTFFPFFLHISVSKVVSTKGTEIILLEGALLVFPTEVRVAEVDACGNRPEESIKFYFFSISCKGLPGTRCSCF